MADRPLLSKELDRKTFQSYYYLKQELVDFCRAVGLPISGGKMELTERIGHYLDTGEILSAQKRSKAKPGDYPITEQTLIEGNFVCSEQRRAFFKQKLGDRFKFNVVFIQWLKANPGKTYAQAIAEYERIREEKKTVKTTIGRQFEYNTYIRDFFADNQGRTLAEAIQCWNYKKGLQGQHHYEKADLVALKAK